MYKIVGILKRPAGMDFEEFKQWWLTEHAPKVKKWSGVVEYRINLATTPDQDFDGVAETTFESKEAMEAAFGTAEGQVARQSATTGSSGMHLVFTEEHIIV
jgi:uncharacterized protein (TIGR02118 family)